MKTTFLLFSIQYRQKRYLKLHYVIPLFTASYESDEMDQLIVSEKNRWVYNRNLKFNNCFPEMCLVGRVMSPYKSHDATTGTIPVLTAVPLFLYLI